MKCVIFPLLLFCFSLVSSENTLISSTSLRDKIVYEVFNGPLQYLTTKQRHAMVGFKVDTMINQKKYVWFSPIYTWDKSGYGKKPNHLFFFEALDTITDHILFIVGKDTYSKIDWSRRGKKMVIIPIVLSK